MTEQNIPYKSSATEEKLIKPSRFITFQHLGKSFVGNPSIVFLGNTSFACMKCSLFK